MLLIITTNGFEKAKKLTAEANHSKHVYTEESKVKLTVRVEATFLKFLLTWQTDKAHQISASLSSDNEKDYPHYG